MEEKTKKTVTKHEVVESPESTVETKKVKKKIKLPKIKLPKGVMKFFGLGLAGFIVILILVAVVISVIGVKKLSQNSFVLGVNKVLHLSVAEINGQNISYNDYVEDLKTLNKFYTNPPEGVTVPTDQEISDQVLSRLLANKLIDKIAKEYDVKVTAEEVANFKDSLVAQFASEDEARKELEDRYGWTLEKYLERVGEPILLEQKLQQAFTDKEVDQNDEFATEEVSASHILFMENEDTTKEQAKVQAEEVLQKIKDGADFAEMAKQYGSDSTKDEGGSLGWFAKGAMVAEFEDAVFAMQPGQLSDKLIETSFGYHIVKMDGRRYVRDFYSYMNDQLMTADIDIKLSVHDPFEAAREQAQQTEPVVETETSDTVTIEE